MKKTTKLFSLILVLGMMMGIFVALGITASAEDGYSGTPVAPTQITSDNYHLYGFTDSNWSAYNGYYAITNAEELYGWRETLGNENLGNAVLINDIVVNTGDMVAAGDAGTPPAYTWPAIDRFKGVLDGRGHSISGLYIVEGSDGTYEYTAFIELLGGEIKNLVISNTFVDASSAYNSVIAADEWLSEGISNVKIDSNVKIKASGSFGAFICDTGDVTLTNCVSLANIIIDGGRYIGSIVGRAGDEPTFTNCYYTSGPAGVGDNLSSYDATGMSEVSVASHTCIAMEHPKVIASCYAKGSTAYTDCMICGKVLSGTKSVTDYSHGDITYTAHATDAEKHVATCVDCDQNFEEVHSFGTTDTCPCGETADVSLTTVSTVTYYATLEDAIAAARIAASGSTVTLLDDCSPVSGNWFTVSDGKFTIDLNGKQITVANSAYSAIVVESGNITLTDSAGGGGSNGGAHVRGGGTLRVEGGTYGGTVSTTNGNLIVVAGSFAVVSLDYDANPGTLTVMGGDIATLQVRAQTGGKKMSDVLLQDYYLADANGVLIDPASAQLSDTYFYYLENVTVQKGADISKDAVITVSNSEYNGAAQTPTVIVTVGGVQLEYGVDYTVTVDGGAEARNAGEYPITVTGIGNYTGSVGNTFTIEKATPSIYVDASYLNKTYNLQKHTVTVDLPAGLDEQYVTISYWKNGSPIDAPIDAGTYKVFVSVKDSPNYEDEITEYDMTISPADVTVEIMEINPKFFYTGGAHTPAVIVTLNGGLPFDPTEYGGIVDYTNNIEVGTATATVSGNFTGSCTFEIKKATPTITVSAPLDKVMPGYVMDITGATDAIDNFLYPTTFTVVDGEGYSVSGNTITIDEGVKIGSTITVKMVSTETKNFVAGEGTLTLTIGVPTVDTVELEKDIAELEKAINDLKTEHGADVTELETELATLKQQISDANAEIAQIKIDISNLKADVTEIETLYATKAELNTAVSKLTTLINSKADASALTDAIENINKILGTIPAGTDIGTELASLDAAIETLNADVATNASGISENKNAILTLATTVNTLKNNLEAKDAELAGKLTTLEENLAKLEERVAANEADIDKLQSDLAAAIEDLDKAIENGDKELSDKIEALTKALADAEAALKQADADNKAELVKKIEDADATLDAAIKAVQKNLDDAKAELDTAIKNGDTALDGKISNLNTALESAKAALEATDAANKTELEGKITSAQTSLQAAIDQVQTNLDSAKAELDKAIADLDAAMKQGDADLSTEIANLNTALMNAKAALEKADADNKAELVSKIETADATLDAAIKAVQKNLEEAQKALNKAIADGDTALDERITDLNTALETAKAALEATDAANKTELEGKITEAQTTLQSAIDKVAKDLADAEKELADAIASGDAALSSRISSVSASLSAAKTALEKADADNKAELIAKIEAAEATLDAAIKAVQKNLDDAKTALEKALADGDKANADALAQAISDLNAAIDAAETAAATADGSLKTELTSKIDNADVALQAAIDALSTELDATNEKVGQLETFIIIVCVISGVALCGSGAFVVWFFIDRKKI